MIKAKHTYIGNLVAGFYSGYKLNKAFRSVEIKGDGINKKLPLLLVSNHFSWWDGFIQYRLNKSIFHRQFHVMMLEEQLNKYRILNGCGAFSVRRNSRDVINTLHYCVELLRNKQNLVLLFPQGEIQSIYTDSFEIGQGLDYLLRHKGNDIQVVFNINLIDFYEYKKPSLTIYYKTWDYQNSQQTSHLAFNEFANECKQLQQNRWKV